MRGSGGVDPPETDPIVAVGMMIGQRLAESDVCKSQASTWVEA